MKAHSKVLIFLFFSLILGSLNSYAEQVQQATISAPQTININTADAKTLAITLKGIGIQKAEAIIEYREQFGPFTHIDELSSVRGIGKKTVEKNANIIEI